MSEQRVKRGRQTSAQMPKYNLPLWSLLILQSRLERLKARSKLGLQGRSFGPVEFEEFQKSELAHFELRVSASDVFSGCLSSLGWHVRNWP